MSLQEKSVKGLAWSATSKWGQKAISFLIFLILSRLLDPEAFGLVALAAVFTAFAEIFVDQGFVDAIIQREELDAEHLDTAFWVSILTGILLMLIGIASAGLISSFMNEPRLTPIIAWLSVSFFIGAFSSTQKAILRRDLDFRSLAIRSLIAVIISGTISVFLAFRGAGVWSLVAQTIIAALVTAIVLWRVSDWRPRLKISISHFKELSVFGVHVLGSRILDFFTRRSDDFLIGYFLGPVALGFYTIAYRLLLVIINTLTGVSTAVAFSTFSRLQDDKEKLRKAFYKVTLFTSLIAFPVFLGMSVLAPEIVSVLFGEKWAPSVPVMRILALIGVLLSILYFNGSVIKATGKPSWQLGINVIYAIAIVIGFLIVARWGIVAVAAAYVIISYLLAPLSFYSVHRLVEINFRTLLGQYMIPLTASFAMVLVILGLKYILADQLNETFRLIIFVLVGGVTYLSVIGLTNRSIIQQGFEIIKLALPDWKIKGSFINFG